MKQKIDIREEVTDRIVAAIEAGIAQGSYEMPWNKRLAGGTESDLPHNPIGLYPYRGANTFLLWMQQIAKGYATAEWATYRQWQSVGAQVREGEKSSQVVKWTSYGGKKSTDSDGEETTGKGGMFATVSFVFNAAQVDGYVPKAARVVPEIERDAAADAMIAATGAEIRFGGARACYIPSIDHIHMPPAGAFKTKGAFYCTAFHELGHWTGHKDRLGRDFSGRFGTEAYAFEELVAELTSAFVAAHFGLVPHERADHATYIASWLKVLKGDKQAIFTAASKANEAANYIIGAAVIAEQTQEAA